MSKQKSAKTHWLGIDLGGTKILAGVYDQDFKLVGCKKRKTKPELGQEACLERLMRTSQEALQDAKIEKEQLGGVGIGCPGVLDLESGILVKAPNLGWIDVPVQKLLEKEFGVPAAVTNDVDAGTFGEYRCGAGKGGSTVFGIFPGTGIGGALIYGGKIYRSKTGSCMEIGHLQAIPNGPLCGCGRNGCLEAVAGRLAISAAASIAVVRGQAPWLQEHAGSDPVNLRSGTLAAAIENGDEVIKKIVVDAFTCMGEVLGGVVNLLAPDVLVIGGGLAEAMPKLILATLKNSMAPKIMAPFQGSCQLRIANLGDHATALGAAAWAAEQEAI